MKMRVADYLAHEQRNDGYCYSCDEITTTGGVEPDAHDRKCPDCGNNTLYGIEQAVLMGFIEPAE